VLALGDLLDQEAFGLRLLTGGAEARQRAVAGAHNSETPEPSRFLPQGWVMLTLGLRLRNTKAAQRALVSELDEAGLCALGFGVGVTFRRPPAALLQEADARGFPIFQIPFETPYREIVGFVNRSLLSADFRLLQRSLSMQNYLMDALREEQPLQALVDRLGHLLDSTVLLFAPDGGVDAASAPAPVETIWREVQSQHPSLQRALVDGSEIVSVPIGDQRHPQRWLVVASRRRSIPNRLALSVIQSAERLLELVSLGRRAALAEDRVVRAELLAHALEPRAGYDSVELLARIQRFGIDFATPARIVVFDVKGRDASALDRSRAALEALLSDEAVPYLMSVRGSRLVALVQVDAERISGWADELISTGLPVTVGGGRVVDSVDAVPQSLDDAELALRQLSTQDEAGGSVLLFDDFRLSSWLISVTSPSDFGAKAATIIEPLRDYPHLEKTLRTYMRERLNVTATARALNLHHNSLRYRLQRIEKLLGEPLDHLPTLVDLYLALLANDPEAHTPTARPTTV
jgi:PucR family transcriptional regulator, purine catabolism regulatory protein